MIELIKVIQHQGVAVGDKNCGHKGEVCQTKKTDLR